MLPSENKLQVHMERPRLRKFFIGLYLLAIVCFLVLWYLTGNELKKHPPPSFLSVHVGGLCKNSTSPSVLSSEESNSFYSELGINLNYSRLLQAVYWAEPDRKITYMSMTTSPGHTTFIIQDLKESYQIGEELYVMVHAKDFDNKSKCYGGDFFQAKLFWSETKASVFGEVMDLLNGSYSVRFLLPWVGEAQVAVRLIHSSEVVQVLKRHRDSHSGRVFFNGYYEGPGPKKTRLSETVKCNVKWDNNGLEHMGTGDCCCEYNDPRTGETWRCQRPKSLPCSARVYHSMGGYRDHMTNMEKMLMKQTNKGINGDERIIKIFHSDGNDTIDVTEKCHPGLHTPVPAGFYLNDVWTSFVCSTRHFTAQMTTECLKDKDIYMMGDSTIRQWFEFFAKAVPTLKQMNLHVQYQTGPLMAVDVENNIDLHWRAHGLPLRTRKTAVANLHYISNEIDDLGGGPHTVIIFNLGPHFTTYPLEFFTRRVLRIRKAVLALLQRAPDTTVIIKTLNTGYKTQRKRTVIPKPQRNVARMTVDEYQATTLTETQILRLKKNGGKQKIEKLQQKKLPDLINEVKMVLKSQCSSASVSSDLEDGQGLSQSNYRALSAKSSIHRTGRKNDNPLSPDYVPSLFAHISTEQRQKNINANHRFDHTQQMKRKRTETFPDTDRETVVPSSIIYATEDDTLEIQAECMQGEHNYSQAIHSPGIVGPCSTTACQATVEALTNECTRLRAEVHCLKDKLDERSLNEEAFKGNDDMVQELTGLPSYAKLMVVLTFLSGFLKASPRLTPFHSFVLPLMRMRLSLPLYFFVYFFHMSKASVVRMFNSTLDVIC